MSLFKIISPPPAGTDLCQGKSTSLAMPRVLVRGYWALKNEGLGTTVRLTAAAIRRQFVKSKSQPVTWAWPETLNLQPGELVEVRPYAEIEQTLDPDLRNRGMQFMPEMERACGQRFRVFKRVNNIIFEETGKRRGVKNTVLLENSICGGEGRSCERSCFFFWRELWLKRVDEAERNGQ